MSASDIHTVAGPLIAHMVTRVGVLSIGAVASTLKMGHLEAPARHKSHIDQHQRSTLRVFGEERGGLHLGKVSI